jgi:predicted membrane channel-forming protein YqfA (hemolysin III family)
MFLLYLVAYKPFLDRWTFRINVCNEFIMYMVSMLWITFTDFNQDAYAKVMMGWLVIFLVIANLLIPNGFILVRGLWFDTKKACCKPKRAEIKGDYYSRRF